MKKPFTLIEVVVVIAIISIMCAIFLPALTHAKAKHGPINCNNRMKQIGLAFQSWASDHNEHFPMQVSVTNGGTMEFALTGAAYPHFQVISNELATPKVLFCPTDRERNLVTNFADLQNSNLSYFVGLDAQKGDRSSILSGDRNLTNQPQPGTRLLSVSPNTSAAWSRALHSKKGYITFGDGSVLLTDNNDLSRIIRDLGPRTNRLVLP